MSMMWLHTLLMQNKSFRLSLQFPLGCEARKLFVHDG